MQSYIGPLRTQVFGVSPKWNGKIKIQNISEKKDALDGKATLREVKMTLINGDKSHDLNLLIILPHSTKPVPVFLGYNFSGNHTVTKEPGVIVTSSWGSEQQSDQRQ